MSKIVIIGAGSVVFSRGLIADIVLNRELKGSIVALCDIDPEALDLTTRLAQRMVIEAEADITIESSTERTDLLPNADYVIQTIAIGGRQAWQKDLDIPMKYGIVQPVGDSVGPGGLSRALRLLPVIVDICHDMEELCPNALLINYSNPNSCACSAIHQYSSIRGIGLCHGLTGTHKELAKYLNVPYEETSVLAAGINHFNWILNFDVQGRDGLALLREKFDREGVPENMKVCASMFKIFGAYPVPGDRHVAEFVPYFLNQESGYGKKYNLSVMKAYGQSPEHWAEIREHLQGYMPVKQYLKKSDENAIDIIASLEGNHYDINNPKESSYRIMKCYDAINLPNYGIISNLPEGAIIEVPAIVGQFGIKGITIGDIPNGIATLISQRIYLQHLTMEAAINGDRQLALQALILDPLVPSIEIAEQMLDELIEAHEEYLPRFFDMGDA